MSWFRKMKDMVVTYPTQAAVLAVIAVVFLGGTIAALYNKVRAAVPGGQNLPAPKV